MMIRKPTKKFHVHIERVVRARVILQVEAASWKEASLLAQRELKSGAIVVLEAKWGHQEVEFETPFAHSIEGEIVTLPGFGAEMPQPRMDANRRES
jgi:hypothetical protein